MWKLKQKLHDNQWKCYPLEDLKEVEYCHIRFLTSTHWYQWETKEWYLEKEDPQAEQKSHDYGQESNMEERNTLEVTRHRQQLVP